MTTLLLVILRIERKTKLLIWELFWARTLVSFITPLVAMHHTSTLIAEVSSATTNAAVSLRPLQNFKANGNRSVGFTLMSSSAVGITFTNHLDDKRSILNRNLLSGSGLAAGDVDGDGKCDLYFCGLDSPNKLYRNLGQWKFQDITRQAGLEIPAQDSTASAFADVDGNGTLDLLLNGLSSGTRLFLNNGKGTFKESTKEAGLGNPMGSMSMTLADTDGDGDLDLYVANFRPTTIKDELTTKYQVQTINGRPVITAVNGRPTSLPDYTNRFEYTPSGNVLEFGQPDSFYINDGKGRFSLVSWTSGAFLDEEGRPLRAPPGDWGLAARFHDINQDGAPDLYVCNDLFTPDRFWINDGKGIFRAAPKLALRNMSTFSMGVDFGDLNRDGHQDFFVVDMLTRNDSLRPVQMADSSPQFSPPGVYDLRPQFLRNVLQWGRGDATFAEAAFFGRVEASEWSWGPIFLDVDLDGFEDILVTNGQLRDFQNGDIAMEIEKSKASRKLTNLDLLELLKMFPGLKTPNVLFRNNGNMTFDEVGEQWGFNTPGISQGMATADLDEDGDLDVIVNNLNDSPGLYRNDSTASRIAIRLSGVPPNTQGIGAKITIRGGPVIQDQQMIAGGRYLSGDDPIRVFAAGRETNLLRVDVLWRFGAQTVISNVPPNSLCLINEPSSASARLHSLTAPVTPVIQPWFNDISHMLNHRHHDDPFEDFERQPLLPNRLSQLGPGVSWHDLDQDGWDDLMIGSGRGGKLAVFRNDANGKFEAWSGAPLHRVTSRDQTAIIGTGPMAFAGLANYEDGSTNGGYLALFDFQRKASGESVLGPGFSTGPVAMADVDNDGDLDLFLGGRSIAGRFPEPADSLLMLNEGGRLKLGHRFSALGLVTGSVFSDLNDDGSVELILSCEWGSLRVFEILPQDQRSTSALFKETTSEWGLSQYSGLWNGIASADLNEDGKMDLVASNWGLNTKMRASQQRPRRLHYGDFSGEGRIDLLESFWSESLQKETPDREFRLLQRFVPGLVERFPTLESYGKASVQDVLALVSEQTQIRSLEVTILETVVFLNQGRSFNPKPLPTQAQLSPAFGIVILDANGDGHEDIFLSQNHFSGQPMVSRSDAGRGLLLHGNGSGDFKPVPGQESGLMIYGEQRGAATSDFDADGRPDLVVTQNAAETRLFKNTSGTPQLRVRLDGTPGNPNGIGARARWVSPNRSTPVREWHAGSGYWSQDSAVKLFKLPAQGGTLEIRWPGGQRTKHEIDSNTIEVKLSQGGATQKIRGL